MPVCLSSKVNKMLLFCFGTLQRKNKHNPCSPSLFMYVHSQGLCVCVCVCVCMYESVSHLECVCMSSQAPHRRSTPGCCRLHGLRSTGLCGRHGGLQRNRAGAPAARRGPPHSSCLPPPLRRGPATGQGSSAHLESIYRFKEREEKEDEEEGEGE